MDDTTLSQMTDMKPACLVAIVAISSLLLGGPQKISQTIQSQIRVLKPGSVQHYHSNEWSSNRAPISATRRGSHVPRFALFFFYKILHTDLLCYVAKTFVS